MAKRKRRTSIRTAAGTTQESYLARLRALREDPTIVLPECPHGAPAPIAKARAKLERIARKGPGFFDKRDKGLVGAVAHAWPIAEQDAVPRLLDAKVGGQRRFYMQRGHVDRQVSLGVQNHDDPRALLQAYRAMAKAEGLHFFARPGLVCTGSIPKPPEAWIEAIGTKGGTAIRKEGPDLYGDGQGDRARLRLGFRGGPFLAFASAPSQGNWHELVHARYAGPRQRQPVTVDVQLPDGTIHEPDDKDIAAYRAGVMGERELIAKSVEAWRQGGAEGRRFILGDRDLGEDEEAFLEAIGATDWERTAILAMTPNGHRGKDATVTSVLEAHAHRVVEGASALLGRDATAFVADHLNEGVREVLRKAHEEAQAEARLADLPELTGLGPVGGFIHAVVRARRRSGDAAARDQVRRALDHGVPRAHVWAVLQALGGAMDLDARFNADDKEAGQALRDPVQRVLAAEGATYRAELQAYLEATGTGEST